MSRLLIRLFPAIAVTLLFVQFSISATAQNFPADSIKGQFIRDWQRAKSYTLEYLNAMPADKYSFKAVDSIRSFAQQMLHLASGNAGLLHFASGVTAGFPQGLEKSPTAQNKDSVVYYVTKSFDIALQDLQNFDPAKFGEQVDIRGTKITRFALFEKAFEHQTHTLGQTTIYIRLVGIRPPAERLF
ncbi:MAG TPA: DinB family protein [Puia sp.]|nr:DinB family protein [Puia sp.]